MVYIFQRKLIINKMHVMIESYFLLKKTSEEAFRVALVITLLRLLGENRSH